jgi:hypothetical protein
MRSYLTATVFVKKRERVHNVTLNQPGARGGAVVEALRYKPEGRGIDSRCCHWNFLLT